MVVTRAQGDQDVIVQTAHPLGFMTPELMEMVIEHNAIAKVEDNGDGSILMTFGTPGKGVGVVSYHVLKEPLGGVHLMTRES